MRFKETTTLDAGLAQVTIVCYYSDDTSDYNDVWQEEYINGKKTRRYWLWEGYIMSLSPMKTKFVSINIVLRLYNSQKEGLKKNRTWTWYLYRYLRNRRTTKIL